MKIEVLFPEVANLYGDPENIDFLKRCCSEAEVVEDNLVSEPYFVRNTPDLIYMGTMTESAQLMVIEKLMPYKERIQELIADGVHFLITGNALEVFGTEIREGEKTVAEGLNLFPTTARRDMMKRFNSLYLGHFKAGDNEEDLTIVGYKSQFTHSYWMSSIQTVVPEDGYLFLSERGPGLNPDIVQEGIRTNNFMATYVIGPILILNPPFTKWLLKDLGIENPEIAFEAAAMEAYNARVAEYSNPDTGFYY